MSERMNDELRQAHELYRQNHDRLRNELMASLPEQTPEPATRSWVGRGWQWTGETKMRRHIRSLAAAAAIIVFAFLAGTTLFKGAGSVVFADVIQPLLTAQTVIYNMTIGTDSDAPVIQDMIAGRRIRRTVEGVEGVSIIDMDSWRILVLDPSERKATYYDLKGLPQKLPNPLERLRNLITELQDSPNFVVEELGIQDIDDRELIGFHARCPRAELTIWADPETKVPVRIEVQEGQILIVCKDYQFDVDMDESLFSMEVPEGYALHETELDLFGSTEEDFIEGLRAWTVVLRDGDFPESIALEDYVKQAPEMQEKLKQLELSDEEEQALEQKLTKGVLFLRFFKGQGKWHYAGNGVKLGDADTAVFWYRPKDSGTYRVVYGDLSVQDVSPADLPTGPPADEEPLKPLGFQQWQKKNFVGTEDSEWHITSASEIVVHSRIELRKGPQDTSAMAITLPDAEEGKLNSVTCGAEPVEYREIEQGQYELQLPMHLIEQGQTTVECIWTLPLDALEPRDYGYDIAMRSLIPVTSYKLHAVLDPGCGFVFDKYPSQQRITLFTQGSSTAMERFGHCGIPIRKQE